MSALLCVKDSWRRQDPLYFASDWFILRGAFHGWLDLGTNGLVWDWLARSVNQLSVILPSTGSLLNKARTKVYYHEKNKYIEWGNVKCGVWCENGSNCVTVTLKA